MKKTDIVDYVINNTTLSRSQAIAATESIIDVLCLSLSKGENIYLRGLATIKVVTSAAKRARNINKGTFVDVPARRTAKLVLCKQLKQRMNSK